MIPKEKAIELVNVFEHQITKGDIDGEWLTEHSIKYFYYTAKQCALIAVEEMINHCSQIEPWLGVEFWQKVKTEIETFKP